MSSNEPMRNGCEVIYEIFHMFITAMIIAYLTVELTAVVLLRYKRMNIQTKEIG